MVARSVPENGDIVVRQETRGDALVYILRAAFGPDQYLLHTRDEAVAHAKTFAKRGADGGDRELIDVGDKRGAEP